MKIENQELMPKPSRVLVVDDEPAICWGLKRLIEQSGHEAKSVASGEEALQIVAQWRPDLIVMDIRLPGMDGLTTIDALRRDGHEIPVVVITAFGDLQTAVQAIERGAVEYLTKPFDVSHVRTVILRLLGALQYQTPPARNAAAAPPKLADELLGRSDHMQRVYRDIALAATTDVSVLITGESGTGKELVARAIHRHSRRRTKPLVTVNLAALSPTLIESELFGYARGAFTGADSSRVGLLELADQATVFFDEIGDVPPAIQVKLLRVLEQHELTRLGETTQRQTDFRVIAATHRDLEAEIKAGRFRQDLYFRLCGYRIHLPPLRSHPADIELLANHFLAVYSSANSPPSVLTPEALQVLKEYAWPGNVRELRHALERAAIMARGLPITPEHLTHIAGSSAPERPASALTEAVRRWTRAKLAETPAERRGLYQQLLAEIEPILLREVLASTDDNQVAAAELLGIHRQTLRKKLREHS